MGFVFDHISSPNYWYYDSNKKLYSRIKFQKHKLINLIEKYNHTLTEWENMKNNGYDRIWDCGSDVFIWNHTQSKSMSSNENVNS